MSLFTDVVSMIPLFRRAMVSLRYEPVNISSHATVASVQSALRASEGGDTRELFALYRDLTIGGSHVQCEFGKRLMAVLSQPHSILPVDKENADDVKAAAAVMQMITDCENWQDGIAHLLSSTLWPVSVVEKLFRPVEPQPEQKIALRWTLRRLEIVNPTLLCFRQDYTNPVGSAVEPPTEAQWESDLRFYATDAEGRIVYSTAEAYRAEPERHIVHRGHLLVGIRDNWGGPMRSIVFWWLLGVLGRDWFARGMERYGSPFPVGKTEASNQEAVNFLKDAFSLSTKIGGLVVDHDTQVELIEAMTSGMADAHEKFLSVCNREISKVIVGQTSSEVQPTGLGSGVSKQQELVREDIRALDQNRLGETLVRQLFAPFLRINGIAGQCKIVWGGLSSEEAAEVATLLKDLSTAGLEPTDEAIPTLSERVGFQLQRKAPPPAPAPTGPGFAPGDITTLSARMPGVIRTFAAERAVAEGTGVPTSWLAPVRDHLREIEAKVRDKSVSEADLQKFIEDAIKKMPELFGEMDVDGLARIFEAGMGGSALAGIREGLKNRGGRK